jgi:hypothetical protein
MALILRPDRLDQGGNGRRVPSAGGIGGVGAQGSGATATQGKRKPLVAMAPAVPP